MVRRVTDRFSGRPDSEHEQAIIRAVIVFFVLLYYAVLDQISPVAHPAVGYVTIAAYEAIALVILVWIAARPAVSPARRVVGILGDLGAISVLMALVGTPATPLYPLYLWIILGNGFRYGVGYLAIAVGVGVTGFGLVILTAEPWHALPALAWGLLIGLVAIPAYAASLIRKLTEAKAEAEAANAAKSRFLATVSHEFRTPLNAIIGMSRVLEDSPAHTAAQRDAARTIRVSGEALRFLVEDILDLSRLDAGKTVITTADTAIHRVLAETTAALAPQAAEKGLRFSVALDAAVPPRLLLDWPHLRQIVLNLVANAIKFTEQGHVLVRLTQETAPDASLRLMLVVEDSGIGIPPEKLAHVFEPFAQADDAANRRFEGSGLGLSISRQLAEAMGGRLEATSTPGHGSRFLLTLPAMPVQAEDPPPSVLGSTAHATLVRTTGPMHAIAAETLLSAPLSVVISDGSDVAVAERHLTWIRHDLATLHDEPPTSAPAIAPRPPRHVLVAEDNAVNIKVLGAILEKAGHRFDVVRDGDALLDAVAVPTFDAALVDINMPGMPVLDVIKLHRMSEGGRVRLPIIAVTADATDATRRGCDEAGIDAIVLKPVPPSVLLDTLDRLTAARHKPAAPSEEEPLDMIHIASLLRLGGPLLLRDLVDDFLPDAAALLESLDTAARAADWDRFSADLHGLRSCAANVGARAVVAGARAPLTPYGAGTVAQALERVGTLRAELAHYEKAVQTLLARSTDDVVG